MPQFDWLPAGLWLGGGSQLKPVPALIAFAATTRPGAKGFCRQNFHFSFVEKFTFRHKFCHKSRTLPVFSHPKIRAF